MRSRERTTRGDHAAKRGPCAVSQAITSGVARRITPHSLAARLPFEIRFKVKLLLLP